MGARDSRPGWRRVLVGALAFALGVGVFLCGCGGQSKAGPAATTLSDGGTTSESPSTDECVPYDDNCPTGSYCQYLDGRTQCVAEGEVVRDALCNDGGRCKRGSICLYGSSLYGDSCQQPCSLDGQYKCFIGRHTCFVAMGAEDEELSFGVCRYSE
jgi:hypothetical protein